MSDDADKVEAEAEAQTETIKGTLRRMKKMAEGAEEMAEATAGDAERKDSVAAGPLGDADIGALAEAIKAGGDEKLAKKAQQIAEKHAAAVRKITEKAAMDLRKIDAALQKANEKKKGKADKTATPKTKAKKEKEPKKEKKVERKPFEKTTLPETDDVFAKLEEPLNSLNDVQEGIEKARDGIEGLAKGVTELKGGDLKSILKSFQEHAASLNVAVRVVLEGAVPTLSVDGDAASGPEWFQKVFNAIKDLVEAVKTGIEKGPEIKEQVEEFVRVCPELPQKAQAEASNIGLNPLLLAKAIKAVAANVKSSKGIPNELADFLNSAKELVEMLVETFKA